MDIKKQILLNGLVLIVVQVLINLGIFVTFKDMMAYAAPLDAIEKIEAQLNRIETKMDNFILKESLHVQKYNTALDSRKL